MKVFKKRADHASMASDVDLPKSTKTVSPRAYIDYGGFLSGPSFLKAFRKRPDRSVKSLNVDPSTTSMPGAGVTFGLSLPEEHFRGDGIRRDPLFYDTSLILLVEQTLFKVPRGYLEKYSEVFRNDYLLHPNGPDGLTDEQPLRLEGIETAEFRCLLKAIIREDLAGDVEMPWMDWTSVIRLSLIWKMKPIEDLALQKIPSQIQNSDEWIAALRIATELRFQGLRELAIRELNSKLSPLKMVELGTECSVTDWLRDAYKTFATRHEGISVEDEEQLGSGRTSKLFRVRHRRIEARNTLSVATDIDSTFASEFADISAISLSPISYLRSDVHTVSDPFAMQRDEVYYFVDIIFLVEKTLFKVPRYLFEQSSDIFRDMFMLPAAEGVLQDGSSDEQPLQLEGVKHGDFRQLLKAMKLPPSTTTRFRAGDLSQLSGKGLYDEPKLWSEWASVLELSCMWQMPKIQGIAVQKILDHAHPDNAADWKCLLKLSSKLQITEISDKAIGSLSEVLLFIEMIEFGIECPAYLLLLKGYNKLVVTSGALSVEVEERLGWKTTAKLLRIREQYLQTPYKSDCNREAEVTEEIEDVFAEELKDAGWVKK